MKAFLFALPMAVAAASPATAEIAADFTGGVRYVRGTFTNFGWTFSTSETRVLTALGVFDADSDSFNDSHAVGIWNVDGALIASATVTNANPLTTSTSSFGDWRFASVAPTLLAAGSYTIGAYYPTNQDAFVGSSVDNKVIVAAAPWLTFGNGVARTDGSEFLTRPESVVGDGFQPGFFGTTFQSNAVPEPATWAMMIAGFGIMGAAMRRRVPVAYA